MNGKWPCPLFGGDECNLTLEKCALCGCPEVTVLHALCYCSGLTEQRKLLLDCFGYGQATASSVKDFLILLFGQRIPASLQGNCISFVGLAVMKCMGADSSLDEPLLVDGIDVDSARLARLDKNINDFLSLEAA